MRALIVLCLVLMLLPSVAVATPQLVSVHGKMTDIFGNNITGPYDMVFRMYTQETEGAAIWSESWNAGTEKVTFGPDGYFSVLIGSHNSLDLPFDTQYWLEMQVQLDILAPRFKLGAVPYTFRANITENLAAGAKATGSLNMNSFDIIGAGGIYSTTLYEGGTALSSKYLSTSSFGTGFLGWTNLTSYPAACPAGEFITTLGDTITCGEPSVAGIGGWTDDGAIVRLTTLTDNVGVGTLNPQAKLHIAGGSLIVNNSISTGSPNLGIFRNDASGGNTLLLGVGATGTVLGANRIGLGDTTSYRLVWDTTNGNVGIGTSDPTNKLDVVGNINATGNIYGILGTASAVSTANIADSAVTAVKLASDLGLGWQNLTNYPATCGTGKAIQAVGDTLVCVTLATANVTGSGTMNYVTKWADHNTTTNSIIYDDGVRIGIGTEAPVKKLDVVGDINATGYVYGMTGVCIGADCKTDWAQVTGTASPWDNSSTQTFIRDGYPLFVNASNTLFIDGASGKIGLGVASPTKTLDVVGDVNATLGIYGATIYQGGNAVLDTTTSFGGNISGTYGNLQLASGSVGSTQLISTAVVAGDYGSSIVIPTYTVDADGRITLAANTTIRSASTLVTGIVRLDNTVSSTSDTTAATANATKTAYDTAAAKASPGTCPVGQAVQNTTTGGVQCIDFSSGGEVEGAGSTGYIARWNSSTTINASAIYQSGTYIGIGTTDPNSTMHVVGDISVTSGHDICIDGGTCLSSAGSVFYNKTAATYNGSLSFGDFMGYKAGDAICNASFAGTHLCSMAEISYTIATQNLSEITGWVGEAWIATGPAKYSPASLPVNDCNGFAHGAAGSYLGNWWTFDQSTGGSGKTGNCGNTLSVGCCR